MHFPGTETKGDCSFLEGGGLAFDSLGKLCVACNYRGVEFRFLVGGCFGEETGLDLSAVC